MDLDSLLAADLPQLGRVSPSLFNDLNECSLRGVLSAAKTPALLPGSPEARLGSLIHKMFELAEKGEVPDDTAFDVTWDRYLAKTEEEMASDELEKHFLPLEEHTRMYAVKRQLCRDGTRKIAREGIARPHGEAPLGATGAGTAAGSELWLETPDKLVGGRIDSVRRTAAGIEIVDYKSGNITEDTPSGKQVKETYQIQLKIYAALYFLAKGSWPSRLTLFGLNQQEHAVPFDRAECLALIEQAKQKLSQVNSLLVPGSSWEVLATPSPGACRFCRYRPACSKYIATSKDGSDWPLDAAGEVLEKEKYKHGYRVVLRTLSGDVVIRKLDESRHPVLLGDARNLMFFNLRRDSSPLNYTGGPFTVSFETPRSFR